MQCSAMHRLRLSASLRLQPRVEGEGFDQSFMQTEVNDLRRIHDDISFEPVDFFESLARKPPCQFLSPVFDPADGDVQRLRNFLVVGTSADEQEELEFPVTQLDNGGQSCTPASGDRADPCHTECETNADQPTCRARKVWHELPDLPVEARALRFHDRRTFPVGIPDRRVDLSSADVKQNSTFFLVEALEQFLQRIFFLRPAIFQAMTVCLAVPVFHPDIPQGSPGGLVSRLPATVQFSLQTTFYDLTKCSECHRGRFLSQGRVSWLPLWQKAKHQQDAADFHTTQKQRFCKVFIAQVSGLVVSARPLNFDEISIEKYGAYRFEIKSV